MTAFPLAGRAEVRSWLWAAVRRDRARAAGTAALLLAATGFGLVGPRLLGELVDAVTAPVPTGPRADPPDTAALTGRVDLLAVAFVLALLAQSSLTTLARVGAVAFGQRLLAGAREGLVRRAVELPLADVEEAGTGELLGRVTADTDKLDSAFGRAAPEIVSAAVITVLTAVAMVATSPLLATGVLVAVPVLVVATRWYRPRGTATLERVMARWAELMAQGHETVHGARTVEALGLAPRRIAGGDAALRRVRAQEYRHHRLWCGYLATLELSTVLPLAATLLLAAWAHRAGVAGLAEITAVALYARALADPLNEALGWADELTVGLTALRRILGVRPSTPPQPPTPAPPARTATRPTARRPGGAGVLRLRGVRFGYGSGPEVLHGVDLDIAPGEKLAVVGPSGAGKSTLGRLLAGVGDPDAGSVTLGGVPVGSLPWERRRQEIALVTQEQHVFSATLRDNLTLPGPAGDGRLWDALEMVGARGWARALPHGLDTRLAAGGEPVGPDVAQRLALARLAVADPPVLVLDEAMSLLGGPHPAGPHPAASPDGPPWDGLLAGRTVVAITHRLADARRADRIAVLEGGRITELGTHTELMAAAGSYAELTRAAAAHS